MNLSIITINYNNALALEKTIRSVIKQIDKSFEYIIVDGGSTDASNYIISKYAEKVSYWVSEKDNGIYDAINKGIIKASGEYLMFLNSGDCLSDDNITSLSMEYITKYPETDIFYGDILGLINHSKSTWLHQHPVELTLSFLKNQNINHQASFTKSTIFKEFGLYPENYKLAGDHWLFLKCFIAGKMFRHINYPLVVFDYGGVSTSNRALYQNEMKAMWKNLVPIYVQELISELDSYRTISQKKLYKIAFRLDITLKKLKNLFYL